MMMIGYDRLKVLIRCKLGFLFEVIRNDFFEIEEVI